MDDYALVLNAGSSSLKFCVYRRPEAENWRLEVARADRGHRYFAAPDCQGRGRQTARRPKAGRNCSRRTPGAGCAGRLAAVQVWRLAGPGCWAPRRSWRSAAPGAHGCEPAGSRRAAATDSPGSIAPATQSGSHRSGLRATARRAPSRLLRHRLSSRATSRCGAGATATRSLPIRTAALRFSWIVLRIHCFRLAAGGAGDCARDA